MIAADLPGYLEKYGDFLIESLGAASKPLWESGGKVPDIKLLRAPMPAQWDRCMAIAKAWDKSRPGDILSADMGTGKTLMAAVAVHVHAKGKPYRAIVVCPPHLTRKWVRELEITLPGIKTRIVSKYSEVLEIKGKPTTPEWWIMSGNKAKMSTTWRAAFVKKRTGFLHCPNCDLAQMRKMREEGADILVPCTPEFLGKKRSTCECGEALYQWENTFDRWPVASIVQKQRRHAFKYLVIDECFIAGTLVATSTGQVPIEKLRVGDMVWSSNNGHVELNRVLKVMKKRKTKRTVKVSWVGGNAVCTEDHEFYVDGIKVPAVALKPGSRITRIRGVDGCVSGLCDSVPSVSKAGETRQADEVLNVQEKRFGREVGSPNESLREMWSGVHAEKELQACNVLQSEMLGIGKYFRQETQEKTGIHEGRHRQSPSSLEEVERRPNRKSEVSGDASRPDVSVSWRERERDNSATGFNGGDDYGRDTSSHRTSNPNRSSGVACGSSGCGGSVSDDGDRGRWSVTQVSKAKKQGQEEDADVGVSWVDSNPVLELGDREQRSEVFAESAVVTGVETFETDDEFVYDITVDKAHNYFAGGVLVSNCHETKAATTAIGLSIGKLAATIPYSVGLTGTLLNGYADSVFPLMWRLSPKKMAKLGIKWGDTMEFTKRYGRLETIINFKDKHSYANRQSKGGGKTTSVRVRPGIVPSLYGECLMDNSVFCSLPDLGYELPGFAEFLEPIAMDAEAADCYERLESEIQSNIKQLLRMGSMGALSAMLNTLNGWPDHPYGFGEVGYKNEEGHWRTVAIPPELDQSVIRPKEQRLIEICKDIARRGRQAWVYTEMTGKHDVIERLRKLLEKSGLRVKVLRPNTAKPCDREEWIFKHGKDVDVIISNPALVRTGLDLFDRGGNHNFSSLVFYQTGYKLDTIRQAAKRAWRIGQTLDCEVFYLFYAQTMQESVMQLMSAKTQAAQAVEGKFSSAGLAALAGGDGDSAAMMLAKMLVDKKDVESIRISAIEKQIRMIMAPVEEVMAVVREAAPVFVPKPVVEVPVVEVQVAKQVMIAKAAKVAKVVEEPVANSVAIEKRRLKQWTDHAAVIRTALQNGDPSGPVMLRRFGKSLARLADGEREAMTSAVRFEELEQHLLQEVS